MQRRRIGVGDEIAMIQARGRAVEGLPIHIGSKFKKEHLHGAALNTVEDAKGPNAIGFVSLPGPTKHNLGNRL